MLDSLQLIVLDSYRGLGDTESFLDDGGTDNYLLSLLEEGTEVGCEVRLALATVDNQHLTDLSRRRAKLDMGREGGSSKSDHTAELDLFDNSLGIIGNISNESVTAVDILHPFVSLDSDLDDHLVIAGKILSRTYRLDCSGD